MTPDVEVIPTTESLAKLWGLLKDNLTTRHNNTFTEEQNEQSTNGPNDKSTNWQNESSLTKEVEDTTQTDDLISEENSSSKSIFILTVLFSNYIVTANLNRDAFLSFKNANFLNPGDNYCKIFNRSNGHVGGMAVKNT